MAGIAPVGFRTVTSAHTNGATARFKMSLNADWEVFEGVWNSGTLVLTRDTVISSSNGGLAVNFPAGTKTVIETPTTEDFKKCHLFAFAATYG